jgi:hypothetical protein
VNNLDKYKDDLDSLFKLGEKMELDLTLRSLGDQGKLSEKNQEAAKNIKGCFERDYQRWYTESSAVIKQLIPDRFVEFGQLYKGDGRRKDIKDIISTYSIQDWLNGIRSTTKGVGEKRIDDFAILTMRFQTQLAILKSVEYRFKSTLFDIRHSEVDPIIKTARGLN